MQIKINCKYNKQGAWCTNKKIKRSLFGIGARCCVEYGTNTICPLKNKFAKTAPRPVPPHSKLKIIEQIVTCCYHECRFFGTSPDGMQCNHPHWEDKGAYDNMIITQDNSRDGNIPEECPLRNGSTEVVLRIKLESVNQK